MDPGSLPSRLEQWGSSATYYVVDNAAPQSAHTYDNNIYVPLNDLFVTFGGASFNTGGVFTNKGPTGAPVRSGPWMWDPAKADPNKVGGTTGSGYNPPTVGGNMWSNQQGRWIGNEPPSYVDGATAYAQEGGKDVIYVSAQPGSGWPSLFRYELGNVRAGGIGRYEQVGVAWNAPGFQNTATIDSTHGLFIRTADIAGLFTGLGVWDLTQSNAANPDANRDIAVELVLPNGTPFTGTRWFGIDYDPNNDKILLWDGLDRGTVWETRAQFDASGAVASPWVVTRRTSTTAAQPSGDFVTGVLGKWRFVPELGAFIALDEFVPGTADGAVWLYRPVGWTNPAGGNVPPTVALTRRDYDGNGKSDIVWRNGTSGSIAMWLMNGLSPASSAVLLNDPAWNVTHTGDLSGDGKIDLLWRSSSGATVAWLMNGTALASSTTLLTDPNWTVVRVADFNGDSKADILWRNTATGKTAIWLMNGLSVASGANILSDPNWQVVHLGDFNGDGKADLVWRNASTGQTALWLMNGAAVASGGVILSDPTWQVSKVGDFNGDGKSDLLWRNTATGYTAIWLMNGLAPTGSATILTDPAWQATHVGDFDGNGKSDIVWRNNVSGYTAIWLMNGTAVATGNGIHTDPNWSVTHVSDTNGDGKADLVWRNASTGQTALWLMNGAAVASGGFILADPSWSVGPPDGL